MPTLTIFANFYINADERYQRMLDSFESIKDIKATKWVVNARGQHAQKTMDFLRQQVGEKLISFSLESSDGWLNDTKKMLPSIDTDFVLFWLEDHINLADSSVYDQILTDMAQHNSDYLEYSWWHSGTLLVPYQHLPQIEGAASTTLTLTKSDLKNILKEHSIYILSMAGIFSAQLFKKNVEETSLFMRQYPKQTPFNFEKGGEYTNWLPITMSLSKQELFANIDDDHNDPGYSLQARGLYPVRELRPANLAPKEKNKLIQNIKVLIPRSIYKPLITVVIKFNKLRRYIDLVLQGK